MTEACKILLTYILVLILGCSKGSDINWLEPVGTFEFNRESLLEQGFTRVCIDVPMYKIETDKGFFTIQLSSFNPKNDTCLTQIWIPNERISNDFQLNKYLEKNNLYVLFCEQEGVYGSRRMYVKHKYIRAIYSVNINYEAQGEQEIISITYECPRLK